MAIENNVAPAGTGQAGAGTPAGVNVEVPIHIEGEPHKEQSKLDQIANRAAGKGLTREHREDPTIFTK